MKSKKQSPKPKKPVNKLLALAARAEKLVNLVEDLEFDIGDALRDSDELVGLTDKLCDKVLDASTVLEAVCTALNGLCEADAALKEIKKSLGSR